MGFRAWQGRGMSTPRSLSAKPRGVPRDKQRSLKPDRSAAGACRSRGFSSLTAREREVLTLVARGNTNRQIGIKLKVSHRTIEKHVERILAKLGAANRTMAALISSRGRSPWART